MAFADNTSVRSNDYFTRLEVDDEDGNEFTDKWNTGELLCLASAVQRSGDKNWVSVSRSIKPFGDPKRPSDWYTPKNCALQYSKLLKGVEDFKKKTLPRTERETSEELLIKNLTDKRITELNWLDQQTKALGNSLIAQIELLESGEYDDYFDDIIKQIEEQEKRDEEDFKKWIMKRESLNATKRLNKCRTPLTIKGKASRGLDARRKNSPNPDLSDDSSMVHSTVLDHVIKTEVESDHEFSSPTKPVQIHIKTENDSPTSIAALLEGCKSSSMVSPVPSSAAPTSPLLTSLLRSTPSSNTVPASISYVSSSLKEPESSYIDSKTGEIDVAAIIARVAESSPKSSIPPSPRPAPASSPLLNSLLKNSPSAASPLTSMQLPQVKEAHPPKAVSSPQSFFNPTSALATAAAQQLAVATSTLPQGHVFFSQQEIDNRKMSSQIPPNTSACLSAPTLSKLLEMPPSTPGRLPPLPVISPTATNTAPAIMHTTPEPVVVTQSPKKMTAEMLLNELQLQIAAASPTKKSVENNMTQLPVLKFSPSKNMPMPDSTILKQSPVSQSRGSVKISPIETDFQFKGLGDDITSQENIDILEAVCESINKAFERKEKKHGPLNLDPNQQSQGQLSKDAHQLSDTTDLINFIHGDVVTNADDILNSINIEKFVSSDIGLDKVLSSEVLADISDLNLFEDDKQKMSDMEIDNPVIEQAIETVISTNEDDKAGDRKYFKSRTPTKNRPSTESLIENLYESLPETVPIKKAIKTEITESVLQPQVVNETILQAVKEAEEATLISIPELSPVKSNEMRSPVAKKPRLYEKIDKDKNNISDDETSLSKRPGRKAKKNRRIYSRSTPTKQDDPKDQYEFCESTEENSVGYQTSNTLCYMPRAKEDGRIDEPRPKLLSQSSEDSNAEKKVSTAAVKNKLGRPPLVRKSISTSSDEKVSDSVDDGMLLHFEDKSKWKEFTEKKEDKDAEEISKVTPKHTKVPESPKKKVQPAKRNLFPTKPETPTKEKSVSSDLEESSACSHDSEDVASVTTWQRDSREASVGKDISDDVEAEASDSRMSSITVETDKQILETEESVSLQGSVVAEFSPMPQAEVKEEKDVTPHFGKQNWFQGTSPKSVDPISQSSAEDSDDSENWDNQSVSTNKSASHSASQSSRSKRKERETTQYKAWKKAINIVLREASCHKFANVFLQKVTNDVAPGYLSIVYKPMDLSLIKRNVDSGVLRTTTEVYRDILLMFQNAVMYNSSDHDVHHMAVEMQRDVLQQFHSFMSTEINEDETNDQTTSLRGGRSAKSKFLSGTKIKEESHEKD